MTQSSKEMVPLAHYPRATRGLRPGSPDTRALAGGLCCRDDGKGFLKKEVLNLQMKEQLFTNDAGQGFSAVLFLKYLLLISN